MSHIACVFHFYEFSSVYPRIQGDLIYPVDFVNTLVSRHNLGGGTSACVIIPRRVGVPPGRGDTYVQPLFTPGATLSVNPGTNHIYINYGNKSQ